MRRVRVASLVLFLCLPLVCVSAQTLSFGPVSVGSAAPAQTLTYTFTSTTTLSAINILTAGASGLDYTDGGGSTCTVGPTYNPGDSCTVSVAFAPVLPGLRAGAVTLFAPGATLPLATFYLNGIGQSGAVTIDPGTQSTLATLTNTSQAYGPAIDGSGNVYVVDHANGLVIELSAGTSNQSTIVSSGLSSPTVAALDGAGNLYISDTGNSRVVMVPNEQGTLNTAEMQILPIPGLSSPRGLALDGSGNLYVTDGTSGNVIEVPAGGSAPPVTVASGLTGVHGVAVDASGNVYVAAGNAVSEYQPPFTGAPIQIGSGYNSPRGLAVDASGAVYVADSGNAQIVMVAPGGTSQTTLAVAGITNPQGVAVDSSGNVYVTDGGNVYQVNRTQAAALTFATTNVGSNSLPKTLTVSNAGNQPLTVSNLAITANFTWLPSGGTDCASITQLASAGQCLIAVASTPAISGPLTGSLTLTDNALNNASSMQTVQLSGLGLQVAQTITFPTIPTQIFGVAPLALSASASSSLPVSYSVSSGPATVAGNLLTITGAGSVIVNAIQAGNAQFAPATSVSQTFTVNPAATSVVWSNPAAIGYGTPLSATQLNATASPVSNGTYIYNPPAGTVLNLGSQTLSVQFTPTSSNYSPSSGSATLQVNQGSQTITFPTITAQMYGAGPVTLNATASSGLAVSYKVTSGPATVSGSTLTITSTGSVTVQASQAGSAQYAAAPPVAQTFTVNPGATTVTWSNPAAITYGTALAAKQLNATATPVSTGTYTYTPASGTVLNVGTQTLSVQFTPTSSNYSPSTASATVVVNQASQKITVTQKAPTSAQYGSTFTVVATATSGLPVSFSSSGACTNVGATYTMGNSAGTCTVIANQSGNANYLAAPTVTETTTTSGKISQTVTFTGAPATAPYQSSFTVATTSNASVTASIIVTGPCSISGITVTMTSGTGTCLMTATWPSNNTYLSATATQTTAAAKIAPTVAFTGAPASAPYQSTFTLAATSNSGLSATLAATGACSISAGTVTIKSSSGTCTTTANWLANNYYLAASASQVTTAQKLAPVITWPTPAPISYLTPLSATQLDATANVAGSFSYSPKLGVVLPAGNQTLTVQFTPSSTNYAATTSSATLAVVQAPAITSMNSASFAGGVANSFTVTTSGFPAAALSESGSLPPGVTFTDNGDGTGTLQGNPGASGTFNISFTAQNGFSPNAVQSFTLTASQVSAMAAARFLEQSSWGPTPATIAQVQAAGLSAYLAQQFSTPVSTYPTPASTAYLSFVQAQFFMNATQGQDQLRQRVAFALSEIMVTSSVKAVVFPSAFSLWMNTMQNDAFGNFYTLLNDVTLSPTMGYYLDMANNDGCAKKCRPNENYGREVLQLFTIGLDELNIDGTPQLDPNGNPIPTYTQDTVMGFAQAFTGWSYPPAAGKSAVFNSPPNFTGPMLPYNANHASGSKVLLNGTTLSAGGTAQSDLTAALQNIFNHPNVGPFIGKQLIQKLVTSNPTPAYVARVADVFNNDGTGVRGNLQAVVTAILLDPEARRDDDPSQVQASDGHLREPLLYMMAAMRAVNTTTDGNLVNFANSMLQAPFEAPSVFNFYPPNYQLPGTQLLGPEFKILNSGTTISRINFINTLIYGNLSSGTTTDISSYVNVAGNVGNLLALVNTNLMHGQMPSDMYNTLFTTLSSSAFASNPKARAQAALYLTLSSSQFQVEQ